MRSIIFMLLLFRFIDAGPLQDLIDQTEAGGVLDLAQDDVFYESVTITKSITINGNGALLDASGLGTGITVNSPDIQDVTIDGMEILGDSGTSSGITVTPESSNIQILNNTISGMQLPNPSGSSPFGYGILVYGNGAVDDNPMDILIDGNDISNTIGTAISLGDNTTDITISNNYIHDTVPAVIEGVPLAVGIQGAFCNGATITGNTFENLSIATNLQLSTGIISDNDYDNVEMFANLMLLLPNGFEFPFDVYIDGYSYYATQVLQDFAGIGEFTFDVYFADLSTINGGFTVVADVIAYDELGNAIQVFQDCFGVWGGCAYIDENGYCVDAECSSNDINGDGIVNVLDVVILINMIIYNEPYEAVADINEDGIVNVLDAVILVNLILDN